MPVDVKTRFIGKPAGPLNRRETVTLYVIAFLVCLVLSGAAASAFVQYAMPREPTGRWLSQYVCGDGLRAVNRRPKGSSSRRGLRIGCVDAGGQEVAGRGDGAMLKVMAPIFAPLLALALLAVRALRRAFART